MLSFSFIFVGLICLASFFLYDRAQLSFIKTLKATMKEQNNVISDQQKIINALHERLESRK